MTTRQKRISKSQRAPAPARRAKIPATASRSVYDVQRANLSAILPAGLRGLRPARQEQEPRGRRPVEPLDLDERITRYRTPGCPICAGHRGLVEVGHCTCAPGPNGEHERYCGTEPCPSGCWEKRRRIGQLTGPQARRAAHKSRLPSVALVGDAKLDIPPTEVRLTARMRIAVARGAGLPGQWGGEL